MSDAASLSSDMTALEREVLQVVLAPDIGDNDRLREQAGAAVVSTRTHSGVGFMTKLEVPDTLALADWPADETLPMVVGVHPELPGGAEFVLQVRAGRLNTIEAFCYEGVWPDDESQFRVEVRP